MILLTEKDLDSFRQVRSGTFGTTYQVDDHTIYKIYHEMIHDRYFQTFPNPALKLSNKRLDRLRRHAVGLKYTDVWQDKISMDGRFRGISLPYYDGPLMFTYMKSPFPVKIRIARQLSRNGKELAEHYIYPLDYKMDNIITHQGDVKIIDLDDVRTKTPFFPSVYFSESSTFGLNETLVEFFEEYQYSIYGLFVEAALGRKRMHPDGSFHFTDQYLSEKEKPVSFLLVDSSSDMEVIRNALSDIDYKVIFLHNGFRIDEKSLMEMIEEYQRNGISLYDILYYSYESDYFNNFNVACKDEIHGRQFIKK